MHKQAFTTDVLLMEDMWKIFINNVTHIFLMLSCCMSFRHCQGETMVNKTIIICFVSHFNFMRTNSYIVLKFAKVVEKHICRKFNIFGSLFSQNALND
jgi:hypothetical protein